MKKILLSALLVMTAASVLAAPYSTRHGRLLSIKQYIPTTGAAVTNSSVVSPTVHGAGNVKAVVNEFAAIPMNNEGNNFFGDGQAPSGISFGEFWSRADELNKCEAETAGQVPSDGSEYVSYETNSYNSADLKSYINYYVTNGKVGKPGSLTFAASCTAYRAASNQYIVAAMARQNSVDTKKDSEEMLDFLVSFHLNGDEDDPTSWPSCGAAQCNIKNMFPGKKAESKRLRQAVIKYLNQQQLEHAWIDLEYEVAIGEPSTAVPNPPTGTSRTVNWLHTTNVGGSNNGTGCDNGCSYSVVMTRNNDGTVGFSQKPFYGQYYFEIGGQPVLATTVTPEQFNAIVQVLSYQYGY